MQSRIHTIESHAVARRASRTVFFALLLAATGTASAAGLVTVPGGSLIVNGSLTNADVTVSGTGQLGGNGTIGGNVTLQPSGAIAPGATAAVGELDANGFSWQGGGSMAFQLGATDAASDHLVFAGPLAKQGTGAFHFDFGDGATPPAPGTTYTLVTFTNQSGFSVSDFSYSYSGSNAALNGQFHLSATALTFSVISTPIELQSFEID